MLQELNGWVRRVTPLDEVVFVDIIGKANGKATDRHETVTFRASNAAAYDAWCKLPDIDDNVVHVQLAGTWRESRRSIGNRVSPAEPSRCHSPSGSLSCVASR
jgi:hypothetical protein